MKYLVLFLIALGVIFYIERHSNSRTIYVIPSHVPDKDDVIHSVGYDSDCLSVS